MRRNSPYKRNHVELMPLYNRSYGHNKLSNDGDIALSTHKKKVYLEKEVKSDDTLQSIALEFNVSVSELKRINSIHKDNEIYARKIIKVPSNPLSLLLEKEYFSKSDNNEAATGPASVESASQPCQSNYDSIVETINNSNCNPRTSDVIAQEEECDGSCASKSEKETPDESIFLLGAVAEDKRSDVISCNGADWGISWHMLILITLLLGVGGPVLYVFWFLWGKSHKDEGS